MSSITLTLPWPSSDLSPNHRGAWQTKEAARHAAITSGIDAVRNAGDAGYYSLPDALQITVTLYPPDRRWYDWDNMAGRLKYFQDGIFRELGRNDHDIRRVVVEWGKPLKGGQVTIILGEMTA
jgi:crossover junction endodeoxyribonuclease RusA